MKFTESEVRHLTLPEQISKLKDTIIKLTKHNDSLKKQVACLKEQLSSEVGCTVEELDASLSEQQEQQATLKARVDALPDKVHNLDVSWPKKEAWHPNPHFHASNIIKKLRKMSNKLRNLQNDIIKYKYNETHRPGILIYFNQLHLVCSPIEIDRKCPYIVFHGNADEAEELGQNMVENGEWSGYLIPEYCNKPVIWKQQ